MVEKVDKPLYNITVSEKEREFIEFWRELKFGVLRQVVIHEGEPDRVDQPLKQRKFGRNGK